MWADRATVSSQHDLSQRDPNGQAASWTVQSLVPTPASFGLTRSTGRVSAPYSHQVCASLAGSYPVSVVHRLTSLFSSASAPDLYSHFSGCSRIAGLVRSREMTSCAALTIGARAQVANSRRQGQAVSAERSNAGRKEIHTVIRKVCKSDESCKSWISSGLGSKRTDEARAQGSRTTGSLGLFALRCFAARPRPLLPPTTLTLLALIFSPAPSC